MFIAQSHSDDSHVNATAPCMSRCMHFAQARPPMSCIPLVMNVVITERISLEERVLLFLPLHSGQKAWCPHNQVLGSGESLKGLIIARNPNANH